MKKLKDSIIHMPMTGDCQINLIKAVKYFTNDSFVSKFNHDYQLCDKTPKTKRIRLKVTINENTAKHLIKTLNLIEIRSPVFNHGYTYALGQENGI